MRPAARGVTWLLGLLSVGVALRLAATGDLAAPPMASLDALSGWVDARPPAAAAVALARLAAELSVWYLLAVSALHAIAAATPAAGGHRLADAIATPAVRRLVRAGLGLGLAATSSVGGQDELVTRGTVTMTPVAESLVAESLVAGQTRIQEPGGTASMRPDVARHGGVAQMVPATPGGPTTWVVGPGDSFWSIAEELLADAWGRPPTDAETDPVWRGLVERNRGRLVDPGDPDAIHPGQVFDVPPLPPVR